MSATLLAQPARRVELSRMAGMRLRVAALALGSLVGCAHYQARPLSPEATATEVEGRSLASGSLRAFLEENHVAAPGPQEPWNLTQLTLVAFYYQPALAEVRAQLLAAQASQQTAGGRPNPSVSLTPGYDSGIPGAASPWIVPLSFDVPIETAGKRGYREAQALHASESARWGVVGAVWQARSRVRAALLDVYAGRESEALLKRQEEAHANVVRLLEGQDAAGLVSSYEVTQARVALDSAQLARQQAAAGSRQALVRLAGALGVPVRALDGCRFSFAGFAGFPRRLTLPEVRRKALLDRADVRGALADYAASQSTLQLEIANQYPDIHLGPGYAWNTGSAGDSEWSLGLSLTLPVLNRNEGPIAEATARREVAAAHFLTVQSQALNEIDGALAAYSSALQQVAAAEALQENIGRRLDSVRSQQRAGSVEPLAVANAEVESAAGAQSRLDALIRTQQALGQLEDAVQSPLTLTADEVAAAGRNSSKGSK
jgi:outer membrane protein TolC